MSSTAADTRGPGSETRLVTPAFLALATATLAFFIAGGLVLPIAPQYVRFGLGADATGVGVAIGAFAVASLVLRPVVGWSADRFGRRPLLLGGSLVTVGALVLHLVATSLSLFIVARCLLGAGEAFFFVAALAAASDIAPVSRRGEAITFLSLSLYLGIAIGPPIAELIFGSGSYQSVWVVAAGVASAALVLAWFVPESAPAVLGDVNSPRPRRRLVHPAGIFPGIVIFLGLWGMAGFLTYLPLYAPSIGAGGAGLPLAIYAFIVVGLRVVGARWPDRFGAARLSGGALIVSAIGFAIMGLIQSPFGLFAGTIVFACGVAFTMPALLSLAVSRVVPEERGSVVGTATLFLDLAFGFAPVGIGLMADKVGYGPTFLVSAALAGLGSALLLGRRAALGRPALAPNA
jgi:predicted MFS family arabinose efflux permease